MSTSKVPTTVFTGFLGSGKTTIISHLIDQLQSTGSQVIYIKNEIGTENIDAQLLKGKHIQTKELLNGCICCTLVGPFIHAIDEIIDSFHPDKIIIEASGAADPAALALMIDSHPKLDRDGVLAVIDVVNFEGYVDLSTTAQNQTKFTDLIIFNKIEAVDLTRKQAVVGYVRELNNHSPIVEAPHGRIAIDVVFGIASQHLSSLLVEEGFDKSTHTDDHPHEHHLEQDGIESFTLYPDTPLSADQLKTFLDHLPPAIYRVKGLVKSPDNKTIIINKVGVRTVLEEADLPEKELLKSMIVCIGFHIQQHKQTICDQLNSLIKQ